MAFLKSPIVFFRLEELFLNIFLNSGEYVGHISFTFLSLTFPGLDSSDSYPVTHVPFFILTDLKLCSN